MSEMPICPVCKGSDWDVQRSDLSRYEPNTIGHRAICKCGTSGPLRDNEHDAIAAWGRMCKGNDRNKP